MPLSVLTRSGAGEVPTLERINDQHARAGDELPGWRCAYPGYTGGERRRIFAYGRSGV